MRCCIAAPAQPFPRLLLLLLLLGLRLAAVHEGAGLLPRAFQ
jgi:hypothetical protein